MTRPIRNPIRVINALQRALGTFPELRVGQLIDNAASYYMTGPDLFNMEDEELAKRIDAFVQNFGKSL